MALIRKNEDLKEWYNCIKEKHEIKKRLSICMNDWQEILKAKGIEILWVISFVLICPNFLILLHSHFHFPHCYLHCLLLPLPLLLLLSSTNIIHIINQELLVNQHLLHISPVSASIWGFYFCLAWPLLSVSF